MKDRLKFRAWNKLTRKYIPDIQDRDLVQGGLIDDDRFFDSYLYDDDYIIEQCTGLKDRNGRLIYEGDVIRDGMLIGHISWDERIAAFAIITDEEYFSFDNLDSNDMEIIGNIHDITEEQND